jgi:hypothetical protein
VGAGAQHGDDRDDGQEDAGKQLGHLCIAPHENWLPRAPAGVSPSDSQGHGDQRAVAQQFCSDRRAHHVEAMPGFQNAAHQHQADHHSQQQQVDAALDARAAVGRRVDRHDAFLAVTSGGPVEPEDRQQRRRTGTAVSGTDGAPSRRNHALQEAQEQRRVAQRRQRAAGIGDDEDEEDHDMRRMLRGCRWRGSAGGSSASTRRSCP